MALRVSVCETPPDGVGINVIHSSGYEISHGISVYASLSNLYSHLVREPGSQSQPIYEIALPQSPAYSFDGISIEYSSGGVAKETSGVR